MKEGGDDDEGEKPITVYSLEERRFREIIPSQIVSRVSENDIDLDVEEDNIVNKPASNVLGNISGPSRHSD